MEAFFEKALESFCVDGSASCSREGPWTQIQEILQQKRSLQTLKGSENTKRGHKFALLASSHRVLIGGVQYVIFNCLQRQTRVRDREKELCRTNTKTYEGP